MATVKAAGATAEAVRQSVEQARNDLASAEANHRAAQTAPEQVAATQARTKSAEATVEQKRAALEQAKLNLHYTRVIAPVTGSVNKTVVLGMNVQPGQQLLTVVPLDRPDLFPPENATGNYVKIVQRVPRKIVIEPGQNHDLLLRPDVNVAPNVFLR